MSNYFLYITGFLIGIFLLLMSITDNGDLIKLFINTKEYFENASTGSGSSGSSGSSTGTDKGAVIKYEDTEIVKVPVVPPPRLKEITGKTGAVSDDPESAIIQNSEIVDKYNFAKLLKKKEMRLLITSYDSENIKKLDWHTDNKDYNNGISVKLSGNDIVKEFNNLNPFVNGYNIHNVSITGPPNAILYGKDDEISKFSALFMFVHKQFHNHKNNLFIIYGVDNKNIVINIKDNEYNNNNYYNVNNDMTDNSDLNGSYDKNDINKSINLLNNFHYYENYDILSNKAKEQKSYKLSYFEKLYTVEIIIDDSVYNINDINMETLKRDITFFGLIMDKEDVVFHLNNTKYEFKRNTDRSIKVGKEPFVINKNKTCEFVLYSFAYFNEAISDKDLKTFKLYNKYKLYGIHTQEDEEIAANLKANNKLSNVEVKMPNTIDMKQIIDTNLNDTIKSLDDSSATDIDITDIAKLSQTSPISKITP